MHYVTAAHGLLKATGSAWSDLSTFNVNENNTVGRDSVADILLTTSANLFSGMIIISISLNVTEICSQWCNHQQSSIGSNNVLAPNIRLAIIWTSVGLVYWCSIAVLGLDKLPHPIMVSFAYGTQAWSSLCLQISWHLRGGHELLIRDIQILKMDFEITLHIFPCALY